MSTPVACPLRVAASPLKGATPAVRQSRPGGVPQFDRLVRCGSRSGAAKG